MYVWRISYWNAESSLKNSEEFEAKINEHLFIFNIKTLFLFLQKRLEDALHADANYGLLEIKQGLSATELMLSAKRLKSRP